MNNNLFVNDLIEWIDESGNNLIERVLWIDEGYVIAFVFDINAQTGFPEPKKVSEIIEAISDGSALKFKSDPWARIVRDEDLSDKEKELRDRAWQIISFIVTQEPSIYYRDKRGSLVQQVIEKYNAGRSEGKLVEISVYKYLRRFWQRGKDKNALLPDYFNSGGRGKAKASGEKKRGRPRKYACEPEIGVGINITEEDKKIFRFAIAKFYNNSKQNFLTTAYTLMIKEYYSEEIIYDENGVKKNILISPENRPSFTQFKYWYEVEQTDIRKTIISRKGAKRFALENRAILGTSKMETIGPGSRYQIDATIADVYLVSPYNRNWIIGRPVIYVIVDVFSRMITGIYVGLEGPSWAGAMMALANAATDKVQFCKEYGIDITEDEWSCKHIPDAILGDRGELAGMKVETLIPNLNIRIENAAPYRADWKGLVERHFRIIHGHVKPFIPGYIDTDFRQRGGHDYRLDSRLDIDQFTEIVIYLILYHNNDHYLAKYDRDEMMIAEDVTPIPRELWKWGIANRSGRLRTFPEDIIKLNLMPTGKGTITARGIKFKGMYYTCEKARKEYWFEKARSSLLSKSEKSLNISYDIRKPNFIYLRSPDGRDFEKCFILDPENRYINKNLHDIEYMLAYEELQRQKNQGKEQQEKVDLIANIESVVIKAEKMTEDVKDETISSNTKVSGIRENRAVEKDKRREKEGFELAKQEEAPNNFEAVGTKAEDSEQSKSLQPDHMEILRQKRRERKDGLELFGYSSQQVCKINLTNHLNYLVKNLSFLSGKTVENFLQNHTLYPFYTTFLTPQEAWLLKESMRKKFNGSILEIAKVARGASGESQKFLKFCSLCQEEDTQKYGEAYWHRIHQIPGVLVCSIHYTLLQNSLVPIEAEGVHYHAASPENCLFDTQEISYTDRIFQGLLMLAQEIEWLINSNISFKGLVWLRNQYQSYLVNQNFMSLLPRGQFRFDETSFSNAIFDFYSQEVLEIINSNFINTPVKYFSRSLFACDINPMIDRITHILLIKFLANSVKDFF